MDSTIDLPPPPPALQATSDQLAACISQRIAAAGGWIDFADYMQAALYEPGLGYYSGGARKFGADGDFVTAPEISPLFARCLARAIAPVLAGCESAMLMEVGPGSGALARHLLPALAELDALPFEYRLLEVSAELRDRQRQTLDELPAELRARLRWLDALPPAGGQGVIVANEVLDALPVSRFRWRDGQALRLGVGVAGGRFVWREGSPDAGFAARIAARLGAPTPGLPDGYESEACLVLSPWIASMGKLLTRGLLLFADYGLVCRDYYAPARDAGTLVCHYRHRAHDDPFWCPGGQDISAWVDFTAVARAGYAAGLELAGFTTQAHFLVANGIEAEAGLGREAAPDAQHEIGLAGALRRLLMPGEMGEYFKFMALSRGLDNPVVQLGRDLSGRL